MMEKYIVTIVQTGTQHSVVVEYENIDQLTYQINQAIANRYQFIILYSTSGSIKYFSLSTIESITISK